MKPKITVPRQKPSLRLVSFDTLRAPDLTDRVLVGDLIEQRALVEVRGQPKCGKTYMVLDMVLHIAADRQKWFGRRIRKGRVVYIAAEAGNSIRNRVAAFALHHENEIDDGFVDFAAVTSPVDLCHLGKDDDDVERLIKLIDKADVVVIDTLSRALAGGDENGPDDMGAFVAACDALRERLQCAVVIIHHEGKDPARGGRGHSLLTCAVDSIIAVEKVNGVSIATVVAQRDGPGGGCIAFRLVPVELGRRDEHADELVMSCVVEAVETPEPASKAPKGQRKLLLDALDDAVAADGVDIGEEAKAVTADQWREQAWSNGEFKNKASLRVAWDRVRKELIDDCLVGQRANGDGVYVWRIGRFGKVQAGLGIGVP